MTITELVFEGCTNSYANSFYRLVFFPESFEQISMYIHIGTPSSVSGGGGGGVGFVSEKTENNRGGVTFICYTPAHRRLCHEQRN